MNKGVVVKKSKIDKKGIFAIKNFKRGEIVLKWNPKTLNKSEIDKLSNNEKNYLYKDNINKYFLVQPPERFVNHSCEPNTRVKNNCDVAIMDIEKGEEITSDYGKNNLISFICRCGSKNCRRVIK